LQVNTNFGPFVTNKAPQDGELLIEIVWKI
jgi:hypothetical protein